MFNATTARIINSIDTAATVVVTAARIGRAAAWFAVFAAAIVTGLCINSTTAARQFYCQQTIDMAENLASLEYAAETVYLLAPAPVAGLLTAATFSIPDLGPELSDEALTAAMPRINPAATLSVVENAAITGSWSAAELQALTIRQLKTMAKERQVPRYSHLRKAELVTALAA